MTIAGPLYLGCRYLWQRRWRSLLVTLVVTLGLLLPVAIWMVVDLAEVHLRERADSTPLLLGAKGSSLELVFNGLYFSENDLPRIKLKDATDATNDGLAQSIPIYARYQAQSYTVVGTTLDYFDFRNLKFAKGRAFTRLGDCVVGSDIAKHLNLSPGDTLVTTPDRVFDLTGIYPVKMRVAGVLTPTGTPDDRAVLTDIKTTWLIEGLAHGHQNATQLDDAVLEQEGKNKALNASVKEYTEVTDDNIDSFHFHGDMQDFPITAAILIPQDSKSRTILLGRYVGESRPLQLIRPTKQMSELFETIFSIRALVTGLLAAVALSSFLIVALVLLLSNRLRVAEFVSMRAIGASPGVIRILVLFEAIAILCVSLLVTSGLLITLWLTTPWLLKWIA